MRPELKRKLDKESKRLSSVWLVAALFVTVVVLAYGVTSFPLSVKSVQGESISLTAIETELGSLPRMRVRLDDERIVRATMTYVQPFVAGSKVHLEERKTLIGLKRYRFMGYVGAEGHE